MREHMGIFQKHILKQGETATDMLEPVWGVMPPIGSIYDRASPADPDTSCVVPGALLPDEMLIREVPQFTDIKAGMSLKMDPSTKKATITDTADKPKFFILSNVKRGSKMEDLFSAPTQEDLRRFRENLQRQR